MKWTPGGGGGDVEDVRGSGAPFGGGTGMAIGGGGLGILGLIGVLLFNLLTGGGGGGGFGFGLGPTLDPFPAARGAAPGSTGLTGAPDSDQTVQFVRFVVGNVQDFWTQQFQAAGRPYERTTLVLFSDVVRSGCGTAGSETGPFYCPGDQKVYLDLSFFRELAQRFQAPGDFAQAYVIAHEFGHHVQNLLGISDQVASYSRSNPDQANEASVRQELQADCLAGVWGYSTYEQGLLEDGDLEEGLTAASSVGDDRIQRQATGRVNPDSFTHGTSEQRRTWFLKGFKGGSMDACDTFSGDI